MFASERFRRRVTKIRKEYRTADEAEIFDQFRSGFDLCVSHLPEEMRTDVFEYLVERYPSRQAKYPSAFDYAEYIGDVIDLLSLEYDEDNDPLDPEDWDYVRDSVSDFAGDLDLKLLNYVMGLIVQKGHIE